MKSDPDCDEGSEQSAEAKASKGTDCNGKTSAENSLDKPKGGEQHPEQAKANSDHPQDVIFLLHSGQPLSYIANLIHAEGDEVQPWQRSEDFGKGTSLTRSTDPTGHPPITFYTAAHSDKRWSPATGVGDFLREAAREGHFSIYIGNQRMRVKVPSFEERTRFLRASLHAKTAHIGRMALVKNECDRVALKAAQRMAFAGAGVLCTWWVTVGVLTFRQYKYLRRLVNHLTGYQRYITRMGRYGTSYVPYGSGNGDMGLSVVPLAQPRGLIPHCADGEYFSEAMQIIRRTWF